MEDASPELQEPRRSGTAPAPDEAGTDPGSMRVRVWSGRNRAQPHLPKVCKVLKQGAVKDNKKRS